MIVALAADHVGMPFKAGLATILRACGDVVRDLGTNDTLPVDYPEYAYAVGIAVASRRAERGTVVCGGSIGACMAANEMRASAASRRSIF